MAASLFRYARLTSLLAVVTLAMTAVAAQAQTADEEPGGASDFLGCLVTDEGGVNDRSFNQAAYEGLERARDVLGIEIAVLESTSETDYAPNVQAFIDQGCDIIITVGFGFGQVTEAAAQANPDQDFAIVDYAYDTGYDNLRELVFATDQAAFLAGYVAAGVTETGVVGTYGGINIPTVTAFMDGYLAGVRYYNQTNSAAVQVLGWDGASGLFTDSFGSPDDGREMTAALLQQGADIILPVAGPTGIGTAQAIEAAGSGLIIWVDTDGFLALPEYGSLMLTSVLKRIDNAVFDTLAAALDGLFKGGRWIGTLANDGVGIAPFHDLDGQVPQHVKDALPTIIAGIAAGEISVDPADYPAHDAPDAPDEPSVDPPEPPKPTTPEPPKPTTPEPPKPTTPEPAKPTAPETAKPTTPVSPAAPVTPQPTAVPTGSGGTATSNMPWTVIVLMFLGACALVAPVATARHRRR
jgi:basic membrane protein A and related proteins